MILFEEVIHYIQQQLPYDQKLVSVINDAGKQIILDSPSQLYNNNYTIKIEGMERYSKYIFNKCKELGSNHNGPVTCHAFIAQSNSPSFDMHTDPDDVYIYCIDGKKSMIVNDENITIMPGEFVYIPANTPHQATNTDFAFTLSFGLEKFLKDKLHNELHILSKDN